MNLTLGWALPFCYPLYTPSLLKNPNILALNLHLFTSGFLREGSSNPLPTYCPEGPLSSLQAN